LPLIAGQFPIGEAGEVAVGARIGPDKAGTDRIADIDENNWCGVHFLSKNLRHQISVGDQHVWPEIRQLSEDGAYSVDIRCGKANLDLDITPFLPAQPMQFPPERHDLGLCGRIARERSNTPKWVWGSKVMGCGYSRMTAGAVEVGY
jgi:hypothetical protein